MAEKRPKYSVILPIYNEQESLPVLLDSLVKIFDDLADSYEIICVDDCSTDQTWTLIEQRHQRNPNIRGLRFLRNFGHQLAVYAGIKNCRGDYVGVMDADGQDPADVLKAMLGKCESGYDVVYAVRQNRKEFFLKRLAYALFYRFYKLIIPFQVPLDSGDFSVFTRDVAEFIASRKEHRPFIRGLRSWYGGRQLGYPYNRPERQAGTTKYSFFKLVILGVNGAISFSKVPLRIISVLGVSVSFASFLYGIYILVLKLTSEIDLIGWTSTAVLIVFFGGLNLFVIGIIGEYIGEIYEEVKKRPPFLVEQTLGISEKK